MVRSWLSYPCQGALAGRQLLLRRPEEDGHVVYAVQSLRVGNPRDAVPREEADREATESLRKKDDSFLLHTT